MQRDRSNSPPPPLDGSAPGDVADQVRTAPAGDLPAGNGLAIQATAYSPLGSTSLSPLVSYSTNSYSPLRPRSPRPRATRSQGESRRRPSTHDAHRLHPGLAMHVVCSAEIADGQRGMGPEGKPVDSAYMRWTHKQCLAVTTRFTPISICMQHIRCANGCVCLCLCLCFVFCVCVFVFCVCVCVYVCVCV
jgi:hypothetical protein